MNRFLFFLFLFCSFRSYAQTDSLYVLQETVVSGSRWEQQKKYVPSKILGILSSDISFQNQNTTADLLQNSGQVFVQKSQTAGGSPVLRGFEASRISLVVDGVRMNNAIYRLGHLQDVITIDQSVLDRVEVLFGPSSTMYGSDALGGVIHFYTKQPQLNKQGVSAYTRYSSVNNEKTFHVDFQLGNKKLASLTSLTYSDFGDMKVGARFDTTYGDWGKCLYFVTRDGSIDQVNLNTQPSLMRGSSYKQYDLLQKFLFKQNNKITHGLNLQLSNNVGNVPRYDRLLELSGGKPRYAENYYGPQMRLFGAYTLSLLNGNPFYDYAKLILSTQHVHQDRINRKLDSNKRFANFEEISIFAGNFDFKKSVSRQTVLYYGAECIYNDVNSRASTTNLLTGIVTWNKDDKSIYTRFADGGSAWSSVAAYLYGTHQLSEVLSLSSGLRLSRVSLTSNYTDSLAYPVTHVSIQSIAPSGSLGIVANLPSKTKISLLASTGFRAPNVEDMTSFTAASAGMARVPNYELKPEYAYNGEVGIDQHLASFMRVEAGAYYSVLQNVMVVRDCQFNGNDSVEVNGFLYKAQSIQNANHGAIYGWYSTVKINISKNVAFDASVTSTYGNYTEKDGANDGKSDTIVAMDHIPPVFGKLSVNYNNDKFSMEAFVRFSDSKRLKDYSPSGEDNLPQAAYRKDATGKFTTPVGMPAWYTLNFHSAYQFSKNLSVYGGVENLFNAHYRQFASGLSAPGRNIFLSVRVRY